MSYDTLFFPVLRRRSPYVSYRKYSDYKQQIREDCQGRCVYCDLHENELGGREYMTLDHFRPKSFPEYKSLENDPTNLVWSCQKCNNYKDSHWPAIGTPHTYVNDQGFLDPFAVDRKDYVAVDRNGQLQPKKDPAAWMINTLLLNRTGVTKTRQKRISNYELQHELIRYLDQLEQQLALVPLSTSDRELVSQLMANQSMIKTRIRELEFDTSLY